MKITAVCPTYKRPELLGRAIHCFLQQTYEDCELIVLDDAGQYEFQQHDKWKIVSTSQRYPDLAAKRQAVIEMASPDSDGIVCWDDDDVYFPNAIEAVAKSLEQRPWAQCRLIYETVSPGVLAVTRAFGRKQTLKVGDEWLYAWGYGGCWAYRLQEFREVNGYNNLEPSASEDIDLARRFHLRYGESADSSVDGPWYWYNRDPGVTKVSQQGLNFWKERETWKFDSSVTAPLIGWNGPNLYECDVVPKIQPRPF